ncbi:MAG: hypothetical protein M1825_000933 [Sarcosagium campestre]|nr:MAG: hypothetical protein M1825_000933 [Sarcosagium campestre]
MAMANNQNGIPLQALGHAPSPPQESVHSDSSPKETWGQYISRKFFSRTYLDRGLERHHITSIAFSGMVGIGLFVSSGELIAIAGPAGCVLAFVIAGLIIFGVMRSLAEMVSVRPFSGALIDFPHTYVDPALGFAVGVIYMLAQCVCTATLTASAARAAGEFTRTGPNSNQDVRLGDLDRDRKGGIIAGLWIITFCSNIFGVRIYGTLERVVKWVKLLFIVFLCLLMIIISTDVGDQKPDSASAQKHARRNHNGTYALPPSFRWTGYKGVSHPKLDGHETCTMLAMFACMGGDYAIVTAGEAARPRNDLPIAARFMYMVPIGFYILTSFLVGFNVDYFDKDLYHPYAANNTDLPHSPFTVAVRHTNIRALPNVLNAFFLFSAYTAANTCLYISSRTAFALAQLYGNKFVQKWIGRTNRGLTPVGAVIFCSVLGLLAFLGLIYDDYNQSILSLSSFFTGSVGCVYASECIAFIRFKAGLDRLGSQDVFSRDDPAYEQKHYRASWQPLCAWFGLGGCSLIIFTSGWPAIYLLSERESLAEGIKAPKYLIFDVIGAYIGPLLFLCLYLGYKVYHETSSRSLADFEDSYFLPEFDGEAAPANVGIRDWKYRVREVWSLIK